MILYRSAEIPPIHAIAALYADARCARPLHDHTAIRELFERANVVHAAFLSGRLVGCLRGWTDGICEGFIAELAVHPDVAREGVGRELLRLACGEWPSVSWVLPAAALGSSLPVRELEGLGWKPLGPGWRLPGQA